MSISERLTCGRERRNSDSRRAFLTRLGWAGAGIGAFLTGAEPGHAQVTDVQIVQFALNLEYLAAEFYTVATTGKTIDQLGIGIGGSGNAGATTGGKQITFISGSTLALSANEIAGDERAHVNLLRSVLADGGNSVAAKPAINLDGLGFGFGSQEEFVAFARAFEDILVGVYGNMVPVFQNRAYSELFVPLIADEAEHAGNLRLHTALYNVATTAVDGADALPPPTGTQFISSRSGLTAVRTPAQVLYVAYGKQANQTSGGLFPAGVNGTLTTSGSPAS